MATSFLSSIPSLSYDAFLSGCCDPREAKQIMTTYSLKKTDMSLLVRAFAIRYYPHELMAIPITLQDRELIQEATKVVVLSPTSPLFTPTFTHFKSLFSQWLIQDKMRVVMPFIMKLNQLRQLRSLSDLERPYYTAELKQLIDLSLLQLIGQINGLGGEEALSRIDELRVSTPPDESFTRQFRDDATTAFWLTFEERQPSTVEGVIPLLVDFIHRYGRLLPNRGDLLAQATEVLDIEFIKQKMETSVVTIDELRGYLSYILDLTKALGSASEEAEVNARFTELIMMESETGVVELLKRYFVPLFLHLDKIKDCVLRV